MSEFEPVTAWDLESETFIGINDLPLNLLRAKGYRRARTLVCLYCMHEQREVPLVVKGRAHGQRRPHFSHPPGRAGHCGYYRPETRWHVDGKHAIATWATGQPGVVKIKVERRTVTGTRRADVMIYRDDGGIIAVELQSQQEPDDDFAIRHDDYLSQSITPIWLWPPHLFRPGILLDRKIPIWWFDVDRQSITAAFCAPHPRPDDWYRHDDLNKYVEHWPPCPDRRLQHHTWQLDRLTLTGGGIQPPADVLAAHAAQRDVLATQAVLMRRAPLRRDRWHQNTPPPASIAPAPVNPQPPASAPTRIKETRRGPAIVPEVGEAPPRERCPEEPRVPRDGDDLLPRWPQGGWRQWICPRCDTRTRLTACRHCRYPAPDSRDHSH